ncbi:TPA: hypothetical protein ACXK4S_000661 [Pseudomonas aeruginosa]
MNYLHLCFLLLLFSTAMSLIAAFLIMFQAEREKKRLIQIERDKKQAEEIQRYLELGNNNNVGG